MEEFNTHEEILQALAEQGIEGMKDFFVYALNELMKLERGNFMHAGRYEHAEGRTAHANGCKPRTVQTRLGSLTFAVPQVREGGFCPASLEKGLRSEKALLQIMAEMYVQGVSTRRVAELLEKHCGLEISAPMVSRDTAALDAELKAWRVRPLEAPVEYLLVDARYGKVRRDGQVLDTALLTAYGIGSDGHRRVLGCSVSESGAEVHWRTFFQSLVAHGLHGLKMIISDAHSGLKEARAAVFPSVPWQRCQFHIQQNASAYVPLKSMEKDVHEAIRQVFAMPALPEAQERLGRLVARLRGEKHIRLADWLETNIPEGFTVYTVAGNPAAMRRLRTTNMVEFENKILKRRTRAVGIFPNGDALLRLASALLAELDDEWLSETRPCIQPAQQPGSASRGVPL